MKQTGRLKYENVRRGVHHRVVSRLRALDMDEDVRFGQAIDRVCEAFADVVEVVDRAIYEWMS